MRDTSVDMVQLSCAVSYAINNVKTEMMHVVDIIIYPIKGLGAVQLQETIVEQHGLRDDRRYMLVDEMGAFMSQRTYPDMALFEVKRLADGFFEVSRSGQHIHIDDSCIDKASARRVTIWEHEVDAYQAFAPFNEWFSSQLGTTCSLVKLSRADARIKQVSATGMTTPLSFADGYPVLVIGTASLAELNTRLPVPVPMDRFRANIVIDTTVPHIEDTWTAYRLGSVLLQHIKPCARCQVITIDQATAAMAKEPLKTLATYRKAGNAVLFGSNVVVCQPGLVKRGDHWLDSQL